MIFYLAFLPVAQNCSGRTDQDNNAHFGVCADKWAIEGNDPVALAQGNSQIAEALGRMGVVCSAVGGGCAESGELKK